MCGLAAQFDQKPQKGFSNDILTKLKRDSLLKGLRAIRHRGPDSQSTWISPDGRIGLGHARLSIIDLNGGMQPLSTQDKQITAIVNGEFYNYKAIRADLIAQGNIFQTNSDSEILIHLYRQHGLGCLSFLRGEFSFILYDQKKSILIAARDRMGIKPLYFSENNGSLFFCSEIKGLLAMGISAVWDESAYISRSMNLAQKTLFKGVAAIEPAHYLVCDDYGIKTYPYWDLNFSAKLDLENSEADPIATIASVHDTLLDCVSQRLVADVPIAVYLSGGLDSSTILAMATSILNKPIPAFNLSFCDNPDFDERSEAELMAKHVGADFRPISVTTNLIVENFAKAIFHNESPLTNSQAVAKFILSQTARAAGYKVVLTGEGADEIFGGYPHFRKDLLVNGPDGTSISWLETKSLHVATLASLSIDPLAAEKAFSDQKLLFLERYKDLGHLREIHSVHASMYLWAKSRLPNFVLTSLGDRMEMANSIEGRTPFLDHKIVDLVCRLPVSAKINGRTQKHILRQAIQAYLPSAINLRKKHYFEAPPVLHQPSNPINIYMQDVLRSEVLRDLPFFDSVKVINSLDSLPRLSKQETKILETALMEVLSLCEMKKIFF
jgi:asparagine synthase (glutamine-hydrolysing)